MIFVCQDRSINMTGPNPSIRSLFAGINPNTSVGLDPTGPVLTPQRGVSQLSNRTGPNPSLWFLFARINPSTIAGQDPTGPAKLAANKKIEFLHPSSRASSVQGSAYVRLSFSTKRFIFFQPSGRSSTVKESKSIFLSLSTKKFEFLHSVAGLHLKFMIYDSITDINTFK